MMSSSKSFASNSLTRQPETQRLGFGTLLRLYRAFGRHYKKHWRLLMAAYAGLLFAVLMALLTPWPLKLILDHVILKNPLPENFAFLNRWFGHDLPGLLAILALAFIGLQVCESVVTYASKVGMISLGEKIVTDVRSRLFAHLQRLSLSFHESARSGDLVYRLTSDLNDLKPILIEAPKDFVYRLAIISSHLGMMLMLEWRLALIAFSVMPLLSYFYRRFGAEVQSATKTKKSQESGMSAVISENVTAMALVQAYGREKLLRSRFESENRGSLKSGLAAMRLTKIFRRLNIILVACGTCGVVYFGGNLVLDKAILPGTLVLFVAYLRKLYGPLEKFAEMMLTVASSQVASERLLELLECDLVMQDASQLGGTMVAPKFRGRIEYCNVSFGYKKSAVVLQHLSFTVAPGETVAVYGPSGAGKSTLISLLLRFYDPQAGQILIDGHDIRKFTLRSLRDQITIVMQEAGLFNKTVRDNIGFGKIAATEEEIIRAARLAQAHDFIMQMPEGYDTMINEGGENLSGGQKQRINIARAIIRDTPIVILDEPATALDAKTEARIQDALRALTRDKTTFIITHKFSTLAHADKLLLLNEGKLVAYGTHEELRRAARTGVEPSEPQLGRQHESKFEAAPPGAEHSISASAYSV
jgi:ATP-binding cassette subfamily B protein